MRIFILLPILLLTSACWTPGPGQVDPTRYPWDQRARPAASYCIISLETGSAAGIGPGSRTTLTCKEPAAH